MGKRTYDPELRKSVIGSKLYSAWKRVNHACHYEPWGFFPNFYQWSLENGYEIGMRLQVIDVSKPYGPNNCEWAETETNVPMYWVNEWNRTVNRIRKHYGMKPLEGTNYDGL